MIAFDAGLFADVMHDLSSTEAVLAEPGPHMDDLGLRAYYEQKLGRLVNELSQLGLRVAKQQAEYLAVMMGKTIKTYTDEAACKAVREQVGVLRKMLAYELADRKFYGPVDNYSKYRSSSAFRPRGV
jgi:hypothetical protein